MATNRVDKLFTTENKMEMFNVDADLTTAAVVDATKKDMQGYSGVCVMVTGHNLTGTGPDSLVLVGATDAAITTPVTIETWSGTAPAADGDYIVIEARADAFAAAGTNLRYCAVKLGLDNAGDEATITMVRYKAAVNKDGLTADYIAA